MKKTKFDILFEEIQNKFIVKENEQSIWKNEEYIHEFTIDGAFKVIIAKNYDDATDEIFYEFLVGKLDRNTNEVYDWPLFESSNEYETLEDAAEAGEEWVREWIDDMEDEDDSDNDDM